MAVRNILLLGNPLLLTQSQPVTESEWQQLDSLEADLRDTARAFNQQHGWGRAISAVQIGIAKRVIYLDAPEKLLLVNPVMHDASDASIEIWDDCMSFPELLVKVKRHAHFRLHYQDKTGQNLQRFIHGELAELLQHELDHLDGIVATMRAIDNSQMALQSQKHLLDPAQLANPLAQE